MRILFLHLSDIHFEKKDDLSETHIAEIASALSPASIGTIDKIFLFVTGDIGFSGKAEQYTCFNIFKSKLIGALKQYVLSDQLIHIYLVPGNHDIDYSTLAHTRKDCEDILKGPLTFDWSNEIQSQVAFLRCSSRNHSLSVKNPLFVRNIVEVNGFTIEINLLNSTIFSLLHDNDQGIHYLTEDVITQLATPSGANMAVTLMHHSHQWFNDTCKAQLEKALLEKNTMVFCGHEHFQATQAISYNGKSPAQFFCGGSLCNRGDWSTSEYFACVYDVENNGFSHFKFVWDPKAEIYKKTLVQQGTLQPKYSLDLPQIKNHNLEQSIMSDSHIHLTDSIAEYYVFPGVTKEIQHKGVPSKDIFNLDTFFSEIEECKRIELCGNDTFGKSALLKMIFRHYASSKCVLFCRVENISSGNRRRILKSLFEDLYGEDESDFQKFERLDKNQKMILIDDLHMISPKHIASFLDGIEKDFGYIIYTTSNTIKLDIEERIKSAIAKDSYSCFRLHPLYSPQRKELVRNILSVKNPHTTSVELDSMVKRITQALDLQRRYVPLTPEIIIKFIEYFSTYQMESAQNDGSIFGKVFESSITNALSPYVRAPLTVDKVFLILGKIAFRAHVGRHYPISYQEILSVIADYCEEYGGSIDGVSLITSVLESRIMSCYGSDGLYKFCNNNYLSYFIAYEICNSKNTEAVKECLKAACFGIYSNILMFVTYITNENSIIELILSSALTSAKEWKEFSFSMNEISHLCVDRKPIDLPPPSHKDIQQDEQADIEMDRKEIDNCHFDVVNVYDYDDADINKLENQLMRAISLTMLLARCLPNFEHRLKKPQKEDIITALYTLPNKIFYVWATHVEQIRDELMQLITTMETNAFVRHQPTLEEAQQILQWNSLSLLLELYHGIVNSSYRENTEEFLTDMAKSLIPFKEETHKLEYLLVLCKSDRIVEFVEIAEAIKESCKLPAANLSLMRVVHHLLLKAKLSSSQVSQIEAKFFPQAKRSATIYRRTLEARKK